MKITIELECEIDGVCPDDNLIKEGVTNIVPSVIMSETVDRTDKWAILINQFEIDIKKD